MAGDRKLESAPSSPGNKNGTQARELHRDTGLVDPRVVAYWREHYDIVHKLKTQWPELKTNLDGKIHLIVGDADNVYLEGAARRLKDTLHELGARGEVRIVSGRDHFNLHVVGDDELGLLMQIAREMYRSARPGASSD